MSNSEIFTAPWYPWYVNDVLTSEKVDCLSLSEEGAYRRALDKAWIKGSVPTEPLKLALLIGKRCSIKTAKAVLALFEPLADRPERSINVKLEKVRLEQKAKYERRAHAGKQGSDKRWQSDSNATPMPMAFVKHSDSDIDSEKELREEKNKKESAIADKKEKPKTPESGKPKTEAPHVLPEDFTVTDAMREWATKNAPMIPILSTTEEFIEYWRDIRLKNNKRTTRGWIATWKNRFRFLTEKYQANRGNQNGPTKPNNPKRSSAEIIQNRDLSKFKDLDPVAEYGTYRDPGR